MNYKNHKSKKTFIIVTAIAAIALTTSIVIKKNPSKGKAVATINDQKIFLSEIEEKLHDIFNGNNQNVKTPSINTLPKEVVEILIKEIYLENELTKKAKESKIAQDKEVAKKIDLAVEKITRQAYVEKLINEQVSTEEINDKYRELSESLEGKKEYLISHIVVDNKAKAQDLYRRLTSSKSLDQDFTKFAKQYSIDEGSATKGGSLDYILEDNMIEEIASIIEDLKNKKISQPIQTDFGWHVIRINDIRDAQAPALELVQDNIEDQLKRDVVEKINADIIGNAKIELLISLEEPNHESDAEE